MSSEIPVAAAMRYESLFYTFISIAGLIFLDLILLPQLIGFSVATSLLYQILAMFTADERALLEVISTIAATVKIVGLPASGLSAISFYRAWKRAAPAEQ